MAFELSSAFTPPSPLALRLSSPFPAVQRRRARRTASLSLTLKQPRAFPSSVPTSPTTLPDTTKDPPKAFDWYSQWYPAALVLDLDPSRPTPVTILGKHLVVWRSETSWVVFYDRCPHRFAALSEGVSQILNSFLRTIANKKVVYLTLRSGYQNREALNAATTDGSFPERGLAPVSRKVQPP